VWVVRAGTASENERAHRFSEGQSHRVRRAGRLRWYLENFRKYVTLKDADKMTAATLRPIWEKLRTDVRAWPNDGNFSVAAIQAMLPACKAADAIRGTVKVEDIVETRYLQQAQKELG
jgi:hypothetical protein